MNEKNSLNGAAGAIANLNDIIKGQKEQEARVMAYLKKFSTTYADVKARLNAAVAEIEALRKDRNHLKAENERLTRDNRALEKEVNLMVNSIQIAGVEMADSGNLIVEATRLANEGIAAPDEGQSPPVAVQHGHEAVHAPGVNALPPVPAEPGETVVGSIPAEFQGLPPSIAASLMNVDRMLRADAESTSGEIYPAAGAFSAV